MRNVFGPLQIFFLSIVLISCSCGSDAVDQTTAKNLGRLYYAVNPLNEVQNPNAVMKFINDHKSLLQDDSPTISCARKLGNRLIQSGLNAFSNSDYDRAYGSVLDMGGNMSHARDVANSLQQGAVDAFMIGQELLWIANVVPKAANGDWTDFNNTGTQSRMTMRQVWPIYKTMGMSSMLNQYMPLFQPMIEEQVTFLALMYLG
jgi:hypothetical protein